jgi:hypothetical protein
MLNSFIKEMAAMAAEIDRLRGQVSDLEQALRLDATANVQAAFDVSETLAQLLILLADGKGHQKEHLHGALYYRRPDVDAPEQKICDTLICKLRKHLEPHGVEIRTVWGAGYQIVAGLDVVHAAIEHATADTDEAAVLRKREREKERQRRIRAERGCRDRQTILEQSFTRQRPWLAIGVCRRTWERRRAAGNLPTNDNAAATRRNTVAA